LISEQEGRETARRLADSFPTPLSIREVFVIDNEFVRVRYDADQQETAYDKSIDATTIAQEFIRDVLLLRMT
jgi:hypothetical protein